MRDWWLCPLCDYDLSANIEGSSVVCPECGRTWTIEKMQEMAAGRRPLGYWVWMPALCPLLLIAAGVVIWLAGAGHGWWWLAVLGAAGWAWVCAIVIITRRMPVHMGDMGPVLAAILGLAPAIIWTVLWMNLLNGVLGI